MQQHKFTLEQGLTALYEQTAQRVKDGVRSAATLEMQRAHGRWLAAELGERCQLASIDEPVLERLTSPQIPARRFGPSTLRKRLSTLRQVIGLAHRRRKVSRVPAWPVVIVPWRPRGRFLESFADAVRIAERLPQHRALWFWVCLMTGMHASDVERMCWSDFVGLNAGSGASKKRSTMLIRNTKNRKVAGVRVPVPAHPGGGVARSMAARTAQAGRSGGHTLAFTEAHSPTPLFQAGPAAHERDRPATHVCDVDGSQVGDHAVSLRVVRAQLAGDDGQNLRPRVAGSVVGMRPGA